MPSKRMFITYVYSIKGRRWLASWIKHLHLASHHGHVGGMFPCSHEEQVYFEWHLDGAVATCGDVQSVRLRIHKRIR